MIIQSGVREADVVLLACKSYNNLSRRPTGKRHVRGTGLEVSHQHLSRWFPVREILLPPNPAVDGPGRIVRVMPNTAALIRISIHDPGQNVLI